MVEAEQAGNIAGHPPRGAIQQDRTNDCTLEVEGDQIWHWSIPLRNRPLPHANAGWWPDVPRLACRSKETASPKALATRPTIENRAEAAAWRRVRL